MRRNPTASPVQALSLEGLNRQVIECRRCPRLRDYCQNIARVKRRAYLDWDYWAKPVPSFGDPRARVLVIGLAPGAHGSNRTGRPFTGDGSGYFLYPVLHEAGFASQARGDSRDDGMVLRDLWITSVIRCAPPGNRPAPQEIGNCAPFLSREIELLTRLRVIVCLGAIAFSNCLRQLQSAGRLPAATGLRFFHGAEYVLPGGETLIASYHPSLQNTNTGKLTRAMLLGIFNKASVLVRTPRL